MPLQFFLKNLSVDEVAVVNQVPRTASPALSLVDIVATDCLLKLICVLYVLAAVMLVEMCKA
jgi:hypothetical protein